MHSSANRPPRPDSATRPTARGVEGRDAPYVPTGDAVVEAMLSLAGVSAGDVLYDLGCGDGRIPLAAARRGARAVGVEIDPRRLAECREGVAREGLDGLDGRVTFVRASLFDVDVSPASVVALYLLPSLNMRLRPRLLRELRPGTRVVSNNFGMDDWPADMTVEVPARQLFLWIIPAWVVGTWHCTIETPPHRGRVVLELHRHFQAVTGTAHVDGRALPIRTGRLQGDRLAFSLPIHGTTDVAIQFDGDRLWGTFTPANASKAPMALTGVRE